MVKELFNIYAKDGTLEATYFSKQNNRFCLEPRLDAVHIESAGMGVGVQKLGIGESLGEQAAQGAISLGGMSPETLIASELMYRACELSTNLDADDELTLRIYFRFLETVEKIAPSTTTGVAAVVSNPVVQKLPSLSEVTDIRAKETNEGTDESPGLN